MFGLGQCVSIPVQLSDVAGLGGGGCTGCRQSRFLLRHSQAENESKDRTIPDIIVPTGASPVGRSRSGATRKTAHTRKVNRMPSASEGNKIVTNPT